MARPKSENYADKLGLILDKAAELFATRGFAGASIADLAAACNASKSWLYHYFDSKEQILYELLTEHIRVLQEAAARALASSRDPEAQVRALVRENMKVYAGARYKHMLLLTGLDALPGAAKDEIIEAQRRLVEGVAGLLERIHPELKHQPQLRKPYAMLFYGMINWTYTWYRPDGPVTPAEFAELAADTFLDGFRRARVGGAALAER